jgi:hypothetical protein
MRPPKGVREAASVGGLFHFKPSVQRTAGVSPNAGIGSGELFCRSLDPVVDDLSRFPEGLCRN